VVRVDICPRQCLHIFHTVSESMFYKYVVQLIKQLHSLISRLSVPSFHDTKQF
jgi:hypothetical protein